MEIKDIFDTAIHLYTSYISLLTKEPQLGLTRETVPILFPTHLLPALYTSLILRHLNSDFAVEQLEVPWFCTR